MENKTSLATFAVGYGLLIATCYLWTYWGAFGINVFEYASLADVAARAIFPVAVALGPILLSSGFAQIGPMAKAMPPGGGRNTRIGAFLNKHVRFLSGLSILIGINVLLWSHSPWRWHSAALLFLPLYLWIERQEFVVTLIPNQSIRAVVTAVAFSGIFVAFGSGAVNADGILRGESDRVVDQVSVGIPVKAAPGHPLEYIGFVGGTFFLYDTQTRNVIIWKQSDREALVLAPRGKGA